MTSTRNKNSRGDYALEQREQSLAKNYTSYQYSTYGKAYNPTFPNVGITPSRMPNHTLSNNPIDIENMLFGINSTNLVKPQNPIKPQLKSIPDSKFFDRLALYMPKPLVIENDQRPYPI